MKEFFVDKYHIRLMNHNNLEEVRKIQKLRYDHLLKEYNPSLVDGGIDDDNYDDVSDSIIVIDTTNDMICGTYRVATMKTIKDHKFLIEEQYDITSLKESGYDFLELGRAVVHPDYRIGFVIQILFLAVYRYMVEHNCRYSIGLCSFHGHDPSIYSDGFSYLKDNYLFEDEKIKAISNPFPMGDKEYDINKAKDQLPGLLKMYLKFGNKVSSEGSIDLSFNSCDVLMVFDIEKANTRYINHFFKLGVKEI